MKWGRFTSPGGGAVHHVRVGVVGCCAEIHGVLGQGEVVIGWWDGAGQGALPCITTAAPGLSEAVQPHGGSQWSVRGTIACRPWLVSPAGRATNLQRPSGPAAGRHATGPPVEVYLPVDAAPLLAAEVAAAVGQPEVGHDGGGGAWQVGSLTVQGQGWQGLGSGGQVGGGGGHTQTFCAMEGYMGGSRGAPGWQREAWQLAVISARCRP